ncbi:TRAP transporter large permease [bacterium]|jgi:tripartite ATP-independent transporter DctM subunit|nr:TRAP transporter large permease [bacterium]MDC0881664.1 TRAP transporter large permease [Candidatus Neomarinimicrobiota bacterium]|tara:strand:- start:288 stop:1565 length:1278 start_codon:yes stop_codon:yes gene_type:complete
MIVLLFSLFAFLAIGVPIAFSLGLSTTLYFIIFNKDLLQVVPQMLFAGMDSYTLIALPLFILMGQLMNESKITSRLIDYCLIFIGNIRGGLGIVNVISSMLFGGISGSSVSDTASIGSILIPEMKKRGYPEEYAAGLTVASSTMGMIIPPSIPMVLYAVTAQQSVGRLFLGGVFPGIMVGVFQLLITIVISNKNSFPRENITVSFDTILKMTLKNSYILFMPFFVVGSVILGVATPTESAALGVFYALIIGLFLIKSLNLKRIVKALKSAVLTSSKIMIIIAFSKIFIWVLAFERVPDELSETISSLGLNSTSMLLLFVVIILISGTFIDVSPAILLFTPVFLPSIIQLGVSPILFGVVLVIGLAVGACTPPVGNCLNVCAIITGLSIGKIFKGAAPFLIANIVTLIIIVLFPNIVTWLPEAIMK